MGPAKGFPKGKTNRDKVSPKSNEDKGLFTSNQQYELDEQSPNQLIYYRESFEFVFFYQYISSRVNSISPNAGVLVN